MTLFLVFTSILMCIILFIIHTNLWSSLFLLFPLYRLRNWGSELREIVICLILHCLLDHLFKANKGSSDRRFWKNNIRGLFHRIKSVDKTYKMEQGEKSMGTLILLSCLVHKVANLKTYPLHSLFCCLSYTYLVLPFLKFSCSIIVFFLS